MTKAEDNEFSSDVLDDMENELSKPSPRKLSAKKHKAKKVIIALVAIVTLASIGFAAWYFIIGKGSQTKNTTQSTNTQSTDNSAVVDPVLAKIITPTTGETWLDKPVKMSKQGYFVSDETNIEDYTDYYQAGARGKNTIIMAVTVQVFPEHRLFEKLPDGSINYIAQPSSLAVYNETQNDVSQIISSKVKIIDNVHYESLSYPYKIQLDDKGGVAYMPNYSTIGSNYFIPENTKQNSVKQTVIKALGRSSLVKVESRNVETGLVSISYAIKTPLDTKIGLRYEPLATDTQDYQWSVGSFWTSGSLKPITRGCSLSNVSVTMADLLTDSDVQLAGRSSDGQTLYEFKNQKNTLLKKAYAEFKDYYDSDTDSQYHGMSLESFVYDHGLVLYKDIYGQWLVYVRDEYAPSYGCAKPVVYLYPTTTQMVAVKVGADVKISDPYYDPTTGWRALAQPSGQLTVNGLNYDSLFWEGPGLGFYPNINEGTVVKKQDAIPTIKSQLAQQGLNTKESTDFIDYWQDKLPSQPYIRLTWFNTTQMDQLAPLYISPKPDTVIRVFLDAVGLDEPINIPAQNLSSIPRSGFTVIEWGGLLGTSKMTID
ncbi:MAG: hypothetical protein WA087_00170 [Candidatus Saccharimonadales bacterium]